MIEFTEKYKPSEWQMYKVVCVIRIDKTSRKFLATGRNWREARRKAWAKYQAWTKPQLQPKQCYGCGIVFPTEFAYSLHLVPVQSFGDLYPEWQCPTDHGGYGITCLECGQEVEHEDAHLTYEAPCFNPFTGGDPGGTVWNCITDIDF